MNYLLIDLANTFSRARFSAHKQADIATKIGFAIHVTLSSVAKCWREQSADHVVFFNEGRSWRKSYYAPYKANRAVTKAAYNPKEKEEDGLFWESLNDLQTYLQTKTNCTVLQHPELEADDLIAGWIQNHPSDNHTIISTDSDFHQLLADNVNQYNGVSEELYTIHGIFDRLNRRIIDKKTKLPKAIPDPPWILFEKCMRGDTSDNIFSAYPGVRTKGTKKKVGLQEAYEDRNIKGFNWNNLMLQVWTDHLDKQHRVLDDYHRNVVLVDLSAQPPEIRTIIDTTVKEVVQLSRPMVGVHFLKFCGKFDLVKMSEMSTQFIPFLEAKYQHG